MATRFYPYPVSDDDPDVSPTVDSVWDEVAALRRRKLVIDTAAGTELYEARGDIDTVVAPAYYLLYQFVSEPLAAISATLPEAKAVFFTYESNAKLNAYTHIVFRKCDGDGGNPTTIGSIADDVEWDAEYLSRFAGASNIADQSFSQGDRLIVEVGFYSSYTKAGGYTGLLEIVSGWGVGDLPENDTTTVTIPYNTWIETGDTFTEASGEPAAIKLGPMFTFA